MGLLLAGIRVIGELLLLWSRVEVSGCMSMEVSGESRLRIVRESVQESIP